VGVARPDLNRDKFLSMDEATIFLEDARLAKFTDYTVTTVIDLAGIQRHMQSCASLDVFFGSYDALNL
jgi:hypothetical protein